MVGPGEPGLGPLGWVWTQVLVDNSARVNLVMPAYVRQLKLGVCLISDLDHSLNLFRDRIPLVGLGGCQMEPLGFILMRVQIEGIPHYNKQQVTFILDDPSGFSVRIPIILDTPTINRVIQTMKESEIHDALTKWQTAMSAYEWTQGFQFCQTGLGERHQCPNKHHGGSPRFRWEDPTHW